VKRLLVLTTLCILLVAAGGTAAASTAKSGPPDTPTAGKSDERHYNLYDPYDGRIVGKVDIDLKTGQYNVHGTANTAGMEYTWGLQVFTPCKLSLVHTLWGPEVRR